VGSEAASTNSSIRHASFPLPCNKNGMTGQISYVILCKALSLNYPQGSLIVEGKKGEVSLIAQDVSLSISVIIRDWAVVDML